MKLSVVFSPTVCHRIGIIGRSVLILHLIGLAACYVNPLRNTSDTEVIGGKAGLTRTGKFLFDALFGIEETSYNSDDDEPAAATNTLKSCDCECGRTDQEIRIVGGRPTGVNQFPWAARIVYNGQFHCGASLVSEDYVLTAAHCVRRLQRTKIRVILGDHDQFITTETPAIMRAVTAIVRHRNFDQNTYNHDIALLRLRKKVPFSKTISPICLPKEKTDPAGKIATVIGWGRTSEGGTLPGKLQQVNVPILTVNQCRNMKYRASRITTNMLCAGKGPAFGQKSGGDSCQGDSGGPLFLADGGKSELVGIVSWGVGCGRSGYPGVYTRVSSYVPWIKNNLDNTCLCSK